ncbi:MAG: DegT/DnrJ/EryC1/StrS family aminotransferase [Gelidibacter sp.]|nr:DegT/DnrJ/EryC1/StrS family aminotransferase [Gelidibacter sp.]
MIPFLDLQSINARFESEFSKQFQHFLESGQYILGPEVEAFENNFANYCGTTYCIGTANGLDALTMIFKSYILIGKLKLGDEVIVPANTFVASILSVIHAGLTPVLVEPDEETFNISVSEVKKQVTKKTKAILAVHLYGQLADMESLQELAEANQLLLIEDAAQAHGAVTNYKLKAGNLSAAAAFSFYPSKNLGCLGDGGAVTTNDLTLADCIKKMRNYGSTTKYVNEIIGFNSRLDALQAAFLNIKLKVLDADNNRRQEIAKQYCTQITNKKIRLPFYDCSKNHVFHVFVVRVDNRQDFIAYLNKHHIGYLIHYPIPPHQQKALSVFGHLSFPITERIHETVVSIPMSPIMTNEDVQEMIQILNTY